MNQDSSEPAIDFVPLVGFDSLRLGDPESVVRQSLIDAGLPFDESHDPYRWELESPWCTLSFANAPNKQLVQISSSSESSYVYGHPLVGMRLDEALRALDIKRFDDTVWSVRLVEMDFDCGEPFIDSDQTTKKPAQSLLHVGTLWIKSLGLGLSMYAAKIDSIAIREARYVPRFGYGPLDEQTLDAASDPQTEQALLLDANKRINRTNRTNSLPMRGLLGFATLITGAVLGWIFYTMFQDYRSWLEATPVNGRVVEMRPDETFPDEIVVEYLMPNEQKSQAVIPSAYTTVREIGQDVELVFRDTNPSVAMTRLQSRDHFSSLSLNWLIYLLPLFSLELMILFPNLRRRWKK